MLLTLWIMLGGIALEFIYIAWLLLTMPPLPAPLTGLFGQAWGGEE